MKTIPKKEDNLKHEYNIRIGYNHENEGYNKITQLQKSPETSGQFYMHPCMSVRHLP